MNIDARASILAACAALALSGYAGIGEAASAVLGAPAGSAKPGQFIGKLDLTPEDKHKGRVETTDDGRQVWALHAPFGYRTLAGDTIMVPAGESTDLASIPRWARVGLPPDGPWVRAAVIHDFLYRTAGTCVRWADHKSGCTKPDGYTRAQADDILNEAMAQLGIGQPQRFTIWAAVRVGGSAGWGH